VLRRFLPAPLVAALSFVLLLAALLLCFALFLPFALLKPLLPGAAARAWLTRTVLDRLGTGPWWALNHVVYRLLHAPPQAVEFEGAERLDRRRSWILICNHQSWADIPVLVELFGRRVPFFRFFLKRQLLWVPVIGFACWAFDMPFVRRHSRQAVALDPRLAREDLEITRRACEKYRRIPVTVVNFLEGTRFTEQKRLARGSPYRHLLRPKAAGLAFALAAMGEQFAGLIDVTLGYAPHPRGPLWSFLCGQPWRAQVRVLPLPAEWLAGDYQGDPQFRARFQDWLNGLWARKDQELAEWKSELTPLLRQERNES